MTMIDAIPQSLPGPAAFRALLQAGPSAEAVAQLLPDGGAARLVIERVHFPGAKPIQLQLRAETEDGQSRMLLGEWVGAGACDLAVTEAARLAKPRRGQVAAGQAVVADPQHGLVLRQPGFDARLPGLRLLHDAAFARDRLAALGLDPAASVALVAHRLGKRAVLRIRGADGLHFARLRPVTSASGQEAHDRHLALWSALQGCDALPIPRPRGFDSELGLALYDRLPGTSPVFAGLDGFRAMAAVMRALGALQSLAVPAPVHRMQEELALLDDWAVRATATFTDMAPRIRAPLIRLRHEADTLGDLPPVLCHRDLHEGQILLQDRRAGLLDFDTLRRGDPALDIGNLQAHLILADLRDGRSRRAYVTAMGNARPDLSLRRIAFWRKAALLRLALIYAFSAEPRKTIRALLDAAA